MNQTESMLEVFTSYVDKVSGFICGVPLISVIFLTGLVLTLRMFGMQFIRLPLALKYMFSEEKGAKGEVSSFQALCTALSATIGTGNIVGVATAYVMGGPGSIFWMWFAALLGLATKYAEGLLAVKYRDHDLKTGKVLGGPFYYIERGMGKKWKPLAVLFAFFGCCVGLFGIGTFTQVNSICGAIDNFCATYNPLHNQTMISVFGETYSLATVVGSAILTFLVGLVLIGGLKRIALVSEKIIPTMVVLYALLTIVLLAYNVNEIPSALVKIVNGAFNPSAVTGGVVGSFIISIRMGVARGIFSNEAGLGSAPIAAAAARTNEPVRQGLVSMTGTFLDTIVVCSMTGFSLTVTGAEFGKDALQGAAATMQAFRDGIPFLPWVVTDLILTISLILFGFTTILGWDYYSERCLDYLTGGNAKTRYTYRLMYVLAVFFGPYMTISAVWGIADIFNGLMAIPNCIALVVLSGVVARETKDYFRRRSSGEVVD